MIGGGVGDVRGVVQICDGCLACVTDLRPSRVMRSLSAEKSKERVKPSSTRRVSLREETQVPKNYIGVNIIISSYA